LRNIGLPIENNELEYKRNEDHEEVVDQRCVRYLLRCVSIGAEICIN
jgi:hypothetical protein